MGVTKGDTRSLDYGSFVAGSEQGMTRWKKPCY